MLTKKGLSLASGASAVLMLVIIGVTAVVGIKILAAVPDQSTQSYVNASIGNASLGIQQITSQMTLVGLIVVMAIVISLLWGSFGGMMGGTGGV